MIFMILKKYIHMMKFELHPESWTQQTTFGVQLCTEDIVKQ